MFPLSNQYQKRNIWKSIFITLIEGISMLLIFLFFYVVLVVSAPLDCSNPREAHYCNENKGDGNE